MSIPYFLDECSLWEIDNILDNLQFTDRNLWESSRFNSWTLAKANFKNIGNLSEFIPLPWEKEKPKHKPKEGPNAIMTDDDVNRLKNLAQSFQK